MTKVQLCYVIGKDTEHERTQKGERAIFLNIFVHYQKQGHCLKNHEKIEKNYEKKRISRLKVN